jgi:hypothetical protein
MKFIVRDGYVVHFESTVQLGNGRTQVQVTQYHAGHELDLDEEHAALHLARLEPADDAARAFCSDRAAPAPEPPAKG